MPDEVIKEHWTYLSWQQFENIPRKTIAMTTCLCFPKVLIAKRNKTAQRKNIKKKSIPYFYKIPVPKACGRNCTPILFTFNLSVTWHSKKRMSNIKFDKFLLFSHAWTGYKCSFTSQYRFRENVLHFSSKQRSRDNQVLYFIEKGENANPSNQRASQEPNSHLIY